MIIHEKNHNQHEQEPEQEQEQEQEQSQKRPITQDRNSHSEVPSKNPTQNLRLPLSNFDSMKSIYKQEPDKSKDLSVSPL
eukprot:CAMPEP_0170529978 /NCGR_PEP_ID=MMETSP0209-20121228/38224_1 /TAXON_ID=665100 ORGANISM="Litonotus pictus, Strain P1" /NCGR_SAMPLE_ID=MMETSP0209 /ASSEMBLY_ACC=CAM_ASM_000301 /LENGTH=79 /DNA_ID=CAMNT_0010822587 /DNA_START=41 /DNA_END=277 /DNA_ORIENTATION=+